MQAGWSGWRKESRVICDKRVTAKVKGKVHKRAMRPAMMFGLEMVSLTKRQEAGIKILRFSLGVTRMDRMRNEHIRGAEQVGQLGDKVREARLRWFGHV